MPQLDKTCCIIFLTQPLPGFSLCSPGPPRRSMPGALHAAGRGAAQARCFAAFLLPACCLLPHTQPCAQSHTAAVFPPATAPITPPPPFCRFARQSQPRVVTSEHEQGPLVYFDALLHDVTPSSPTGLAARPMYRWAGVGRGGVGWAPWEQPGSCL